MSRGLCHVSVEVVARPRLSVLVLGSEWKRRGSARFVAEWGQQGHPLIGVGHEARLCCFRWRCHSQKLSMRMACPKGSSLPSGFGLALEDHWTCDARCHLELDTHSDPGVLRRSNRPVITEGTVCFGTGNRNGLASMLPGLGAGRFGLGTDETLRRGVLYQKAVMEEWGRGVRFR